MGVPRSFHLLSPHLTRIAKSVLKNGGYAIGVLPNFMKTREIDHTGLSECHYVESMHERKQKMASLADAFVCLPGGYGTFEEMMEMITWVQLKLHSKPVLLFNVNGFYDGLIKFVDSAVDAGFIRPDLRQVTLLSTDKVEAVIPQLEEWDGSDIVDILALKKAVGSDEGAGNLNLT